MNPLFDYHAPRFPNVAGLGVERTNPIVAQELEVAGIPYTLLPTHDPHREVHTTVKAALPGFELVRCWYYWSVCGNVALAVAVALNAVAPWCQREIRVDGHCMCPPPEDYARATVKEMAALGARFMKREDQLRFNALQPGESIEVEFPDIEDEGTGRARLVERQVTVTRGEHPLPLYVDCYHVDTQRGLCHLVAALREHGVIP